jgi:putative ABC transport system ATP-binding protein
MSSVPTNPERSGEVPVISARGLGRTYDLGGTVLHALRDVDIDIYKGEFVAIVGSSGSGKSTLMNLLGLLDRPSTGMLRVDGIDVSGLDRDARSTMRNRKVGFIFQGFNLLRRTSAMENVELPMIYAGLPARERRTRAMQSLELVGLGQRADHMPNQLSGGQQQRVAIARALVNRPSLLLADEPTGNLDSTTTRDILEVFLKLNLEQGITIVMVTHEHDVAAVARRVVQFQDGQMKYDGPPPAEWLPMVATPWRAAAAEVG